MNETLRRVAHEISHVLSRPFIWSVIDPRYRPRIEPGSDRMPRPPFIMVANHNTFLDPWIIGRYSIRPVFYMCNDDAWRAGKVTQTYLNCIGAFPKKKGGADFKAIKTTLKILERGSPVCIFPEGQTSWTGETQLIYMGMEKLIRRAKVPLVIFNLCGNFLMKPWWAESLRSGRVLVRVRVLTPEKIASMSDDDLFLAVKQGIYQNDIKDERNRAAKFTGTNLAAGIERLVWICMHCGREDTLSASGDDISCSSCGSRWRMDAHFRLRPLTDGATTLTDLKDWCDMQRARVLERIAAVSAGNEIARSDHVTLETLEPDGYTFAARGIGALSVDSSRLAFEPSDGSATALSMPLGELHDTVIQKKDVFEVRWDSKYWRFVFDHRSPMKWVYYVRYLKGYEEIERRGYL